MLYALYHLVTDTHMNDNDLSRWADVLGGAIDAVLTVGVLYGLTMLL